MITKVCGIYFSATGNTKKITETVAAQLAKDLGCPMELKDFTAPAARTEVKEFPADTLVVAGSPTYAGKLPNKILPDFQTKLKGNGTPAVAVVTFGNRSFDNSLAELVSVLTAGGFRPVGGAAFACRHAFSDLLAGGRPSAEDLAAAEVFADHAAALAEKAELPGLYREIGEAYRRLDSWSMYLISSYEDTEKAIGRKADRNRKIYNGMLRTYVYQYLGPRPPRRTHAEH